MRRVVVLGAGVAGLTAAQALTQRESPPLVLEGSSAVGGLTRSMVVGEDSFDFTGHFLHLSRSSDPTGLPVARLRAEDWVRHRRRAVGWLGGRFVTAPVQYHLGELEPELARECLATFERRPPAGPAASLEDYLVQGFGTCLAERFLLPLNAKTLGLPARCLEATAATRFFPHPDVARIRSGFTAPGADPSGYNATFWYPRRGGIEKLVEALSAGVEVSLEEPALALELDNRRLRTNRGWHAWERLYSSLPLPVLCSLTDDPELRGWGNELTHSSTLCLNVSVEGRLCPELEGVHWLYAADPELDFYRLGFYSNVQPGPSGAVRLFAEIGCLPGEADNWLERNLVGSLLQRLNDLGWLVGRRLRCAVIYPIRCAYVHFTEARSRRLPQILARLAQAGVRPIGRYGRWDHLSIEDCIYTTLETVEAG